ncbi:MAG: DUF898 domain-containing protein [Sulfurovaceae bacterium]|nr:DUF898 domain-containing protein [Sulfurovaceae bacterium]
MEEQHIKESQSNNYHTFSFEGSGAEFFRIWIVNIALTILTLGIYSAWAKVRTNRYIYANTYLNGSNFEYNADPIKILIGRIIVVGVYAAFVIFSEYLMMFEVAGVIAFIAFMLMPWLVRQAVSFKLRNTSYRNIPFKYTGKTSDFYLFFLIHGLLNIVTLFLVFPYSYSKFKKLIIGKSEYGQGKFNFNGTAGEVYSIYILIFVWSILFMMGMVMLFSLIGLVFSGVFGEELDMLNETAQMASVFTELNATMIDMNSTMIDANSSMVVDENITYSEEDMEAIGITSLVGLGVMMLLYLPLIFWQKGFSDGHFSNYVCNFSKLNSSPLKGTMSPFKLGMISLSNFIMIILSLGLLYPWAKIRYLRYKLEHTHFRCSDYEQFESLGYETGSTVGEEMVDFFDIDVGL